MRQEAQDFLAAGRQFIDKTQNPEKAIRALVRTAASTSGSEMGSLYLVDKLRGVLLPYILVNLPPEYTAGCEAVPLGSQCCGRAALHKIPWFVEDMWSDPLFVDCRQAAINAGMRAAFSIPVMSEAGECIGSLASHFREVHRPERITIEKFQLLSQLIAYALARNSSTALAGI